MPPQCTRSSHNDGRAVHSIDDDEEWSVKAERQTSVKMKSAIYRGKGYDCIPVVMNRLF